MESKHNMFSVVIPTHNYAHTVERAVRSVINQSVRNWELLVIDDGSSDDSAAILKQLAAVHGGQFRYIRQENAGLSATRNKAIDNTTGEYLIFLDADDELEKDALALLQRSAEKNPQAGMLIGGHISVMPDRREKYRALPALHHKSILQRLHMYLITKTLSINNGAVAMKRNIFSRYRYREDLRATEDIPMFAFALANFDAETISAPLAKIHKHDDSLRHNTKHARDIGMTLVEEVFATERMPPEVQKLKRKFSARRALSLCRSLYRKKEYKAARKFYFLALRHDFLACCTIRYLRWLIRSFL